MHRPLQLPWRLPTLVVLVVGLVLVAAGCGSSSSTSTATSVELQVTLNPGGGAGHVQEWSVTCPSTTHSAACATLAATPDAFTPHPAGSACTMIYGGPQVLTVNGHVGDRQVAYTTGRGNGCEIADFSRDLALVVPFRRA
jgi:hypothetical protein